MKEALVFALDATIDVRTDIQISCFLIFGLQLDKHTDARSKTCSIFITFFADHRKSVRHAGKFLFTIVFRKNNLYFDKSYDLCALLGLRFVLSTELRHRQAKRRQQKQVVPFLHSIPPGGLEPFLDLKPFAELTAISRPLKA